MQITLNCGMLELLKILLQTIWVSCVQGWCNGWRHLLLAVLLWLWPLLWIHEYSNVVAVVFFYVYIYFFPLTLNPVVNKLSTWKLYLVCCSLLFFFVLWFFFFSWLFISLSVFCCCNKNSAYITRLPAFIRCCCYFPL